MAYHLVTRGKCCIPVSPFLFLISSVLIPSFIATRVVAELDVCLQTHFVVCFSRQIGGVYVT